MKQKKQSNLIQGFVVFLVIIGIAFEAINQTLPPDAFPASAPATEFSAESAIAHIMAITE